MNCFVSFICVISIITACIESELIRLYPAGSDYYFDGSVANLWRSTFYIEPPNNIVFDSSERGPWQLIKVDDIDKTGIHGKLASDWYFISSQYPIKRIELTDRSVNRAGGWLNQIYEDVTDFEFALQLISSCYGCPIELSIGIFGDASGAKRYTVQEFIGVGDFKGNDVLDARMEITEAVHLFYETQLNITRIEIFDLSRNPTGTSLQIIDGGIGYEYLRVNLKPIAASSDPFNILLVLYGSDPLNSSGNFQLGVFVPGLKFLNTVTLHKMSLDGFPTRGRIQYEGNEIIVFVQAIDRTRVGADTKYTVLHGIGHTSLEIDFYSEQGRDLHYSILVWGNTDLFGK